MSHKFFVRIIFTLILATIAISCSKSEFKKNEPNQGNHRDHGNPANPTTPQSCHGEQGQEEIFGSLAYEVYDATSLEIFWNHFERNNPAIAFYQLVIMDERMNEAGTFKSPLFSGTSFYVHPHALDINGQSLKNKIQYQKGKWYWYHLYAYDEYRQPVRGHLEQVHHRKVDIQQTNYHSRTRFVGFCNGYGGY